VARGGHRLARRAQPEPRRGSQELDDGQTVELSRESLLEPLDGALRAMSLAVVLLAAGVVIGRL
jgi:hypothetical protein